MSAFQPFSVIYLDISMYAKKKTVTTGSRFIAFVEPPPPFPKKKRVTCLPEGRVRLQVVELF